MRKRNREISRGTIRKNLLVLFLIMSVSLIGAAQEDASNDLLKQLLSEQGETVRNVINDPEKLQGSNPVYPDRSG